MSEIAHSAREAVESTPRERLRPREKALILERQHDRCAGPCGESLIWSVIDGKPVYGPMIDEHILPIWLGGSNDLSNRELRCVPCAKAKTREDMKRINKTKRLERDANPETRRHSPHRLRSRGFQKDPLR